MDLLQVIYSSRPFGFDQGVLNGILLQSRRNNDAFDITGALICRADLYLQLLEGPPDAVDAAYARIRTDDRHAEVTLHVRAPVGERLFGAWAMRDDPARSWLWSQAEVADGALTRATPADLAAVFARLAAEA
jgi:hypothetical protein